MERLPPGIEFIILPTGIDFTLPGQRAPWDEQADVSQFDGLPFGGLIGSLPSQQESAAQQRCTINNSFGAYVGRT